MARSNGAAKTTTTTETSAIVSIEALLAAHEADMARAAEEAERAARRRKEERAAEEVRARQAAEAERRRLELEEEERRRAAELHAAEIAAMKQAAVERARVEAERGAEQARRAAELEHERRLEAMKNDAGKRRLQRGIAATIAVLCVALAGGGVVLHQQRAREIAAEEQAKDLAAKLDDLQKNIASLRDEKAKASDPAKIAALERRIAEQQAEIDRMKPPPSAATAKPIVRTTAIPTPTAQKPDKKPCICQEGDPTCDTTSCQVVRKR